MGHDAIQSYAKHNYLVLPLINTCTLGIYGMVAPEQGELVASDELQEAMGIQAENLD